MNIYVNLSTVLSGIGSDLSPLNYHQLKNYFNPDDGVPCVVTPSAGDILLVKGVIEPGTESFLTIKRNIAGEITIKSWDILNNGIWLVDAKNMTGYAYFIREITGYFIQSLIIKDFAFLRNNSSETHPISLDQIRLSESSITFKNFMFYIGGDMTIRNSPATTLKMYGCTVYSSNNIRMINNNDDDRWNMYDGIVRADRIYDYE